MNLRGSSRGRLYGERRYGAGDINALNELQALAEREPSSPSPRASIARSLSSFNEFIPAAEKYLEAAGLSKAERGAQFRIAAAHSFRKGKQLSYAKELLVDILTDSTAQFP